MRISRLEKTILGLMISGCMSLGFAQVVRVIDFESGEYNQGCNTGLHPCQDMTSGCDCGIGTSMKVVSKDEGHPVRAGTYSSYHRLANCHERAEWFDQCPLGYEKEVWVGWSMYITPQFSGGGIISQFHDRFGGGGVSNDPNKPGPCSGYSHGGPTTFNFGGSRATVSMRREANGCIQHKGIGGGPFGKGQWYDMVVNAVFSNDQSKGFFKMWIYKAGAHQAGAQPGNPNIDYKGSTYWAHRDGSTNGGPLFRAGIYRGNPGKVPGNPVVLYVDEIRWGHTANGASFDDVAPGISPHSGLDPSQLPPEGPTGELDFTAPHIKLNLGGGGVGEWHDGDKFAQGGESYTFSGFPIVDGVPNAAPAAVYQRCRHWEMYVQEPFTYEFPGLPNGDYLLRFHFIDQFGGRAMDILVENGRRIEDFDPITEAGAPMKAVVKEVEASVIDGNGMTIKFMDDQPTPKDFFCSGLEIISKNPTSLHPWCGRAASGSALSVRRVGKGVSVSIRRRGSYLLEIIAPDGSVFRSIQGRGPHTSTLRTEMNPGLYLVRLTAGGEKNVQPMVIGR